jgi:type II secretory pathway predicted ATPase ExeA
MESYCTFFGFEKEPFPTELALKDIFETDALAGVKERFAYILRIGGVALVTGEIGSGKSTALRYAAGALHPSQYTVYYITASSGSIMELYRQITEMMKIDGNKISKALMVAQIKNEIKEKVISQKKKPILVIDEAFLLRLDVFSELHTLCQFDQDSKNCLPMILAGRSSLIDRLMYPQSASLASRVIARAHLPGLDIESTKQYLTHHLKLTGVDINLFEDAAVTAIHQASGGLLRKTNQLGRGSLMAAAADHERVVNPDHVRRAASELI